MTFVEVLKDQYPEKVMKNLRRLILKKWPVTCFIFCWIGMLTSHISSAQADKVSDNLNLDSLMLDSKIALFKNQLPKGWQLDYTNERLYIFFSEKVWFPFAYVHDRNIPDRKVISEKTSYEYRNGKKIIVVETNPSFILKVSSIWTEKQLKDTIHYNDEIWKQGSLAKERIKKVPTHLTEKFNLFLESEYNFKDYLPTFLFTDMGLIKKKINQLWAIQL